MILELSKNASKARNDKPRKKHFYLHIKLSTNNFGSKIVNNGDGYVSNLKNCVALFQVRISYLQT